VYWVNYPLPPLSRGGIQHRAVPYVCVCLCVYNFTVYTITEKYWSYFVGTLGTLGQHEFGSTTSLAVEDLIFLHILSILYSIKVIFGSTILLCTLELQVNANWCSKYENCWNKGFLPLFKIQCTESANICNNNCLLFLTDVLFWILSMTS